MTPCEPIQGLGFRAIICRRGKTRTQKDEDDDILADMRRQLGAPPT